jgi:hypothetical protein
MTVLLETAWVLGLPGVQVEDEDAVEAAVALGSAEDVRFRFDKLG